jgi:hypothetical protein
MAVPTARSSDGSSSHPSSWMQQCPISILGLIFAPWTILMYMVVFPLNGWDWIWIGLATGADIVSYTGDCANRQQVPSYTGP